MKKGVGPFYFPFLLAAAVSCRRLYLEGQRTTVLGEEDPGSWGSSSESECSLVKQK
jgi:hypothetical protein